MTEFQNSGNFVVLNSFQPMQVENPNLELFWSMPQEPLKWSRTHERALVWPGEVREFHIVWKVTTL